MIGTSFGRYLGAWLLLVTISFPSFASAQDPTEGFWVDEDETVEGLDVWDDYQSSPPSIDLNQPIDLDSIRRQARKTSDGSFRSAGFNRIGVGHYSYFGVVLGHVRRLSNGHQVSGNGNYASLIGGAEGHVASTRFGLLYMGVRARLGGNNWDGKEWEGLTYEGVIAFSLTLLGAPDKRGGRSDFSLNIHVGPAISHESGSTNTYEKERQLNLLAVVGGRFEYGGWFSRTGRKVIRTTSGIVTLESGWLPSVYLEVDVAIAFYSEAKDTFQNEESNPDYVRLDLGFYIYQGFFEPLPDVGLKISAGFGASFLFSERQEGELSEELIGKDSVLSSLVFNIRASVNDWLNFQLWAKLGQDSVAHDVRGEIGLNIVLATWGGATQKGRGMGISVPTKGYRPASSAREWTR